MPDFNQEQPPKKITDPNASGDKRYPAHVHKFVAAGRMNEFLEVKNDDEKATALADGWSEMPVHEAPKAKKGKAE